MKIYWIVKKFDKREVGTEVSTLHESVAKKLEMGKYITSKKPKNAIDPAETTEGQETVDEGSSSED